MLPATGIAYVRTRKGSLNAGTGWHHHRNAVAHITVLEFEMAGNKEYRMSELVSYLEDFCSGIRPFDLRFTCQDKMGRGLHLLPSLNSEAFLSAVVMACARRFPFMSFKTVKPHIIISRRLETDDAHGSRERMIMEQQDIRFEADGFYLRHLNERSKRQEVIAKFAFRGRQTALPAVVAQPALFD
jgi:hypothetical protein